MKELLIEYYLKWKTHNLVINKPPAQPKPNHELGAKHTPAIPRKKLNHFLKISNVPAGFDGVDNLLEGF